MFAIQSSYDLIVLLGKHQCCFYLVNFVISHIALALETAQFSIIAIFQKHKRLSDLDHPGVVGRDLNAGRVNDVSGQHDGPVEEEEDEERGSRGQHHRHLRVLVAVG